MQRHLTFGLSRDARAHGHCDAPIRGYEGAADRYPT